MRVAPRARVEDMATTPFTRARTGRYMITVRSLDADAGESPPVLVAADTAEEAIERFFESCPRIWESVASGSPRRTPFDRARWEVVSCEDVTAHARANGRPKQRPGLTPKGIATSLAFAVLFFAGAALSATAGDVAVGLVTSTGDVAALTTTGEGSIPPGEIPPEDDTGEGDGAGEPIPAPEVPPSDGEPVEAAPDAEPPAPDPAPAAPSEPQSPEAPTPSPEASPPSAGASPGAAPNAGHSSSSEDAQASQPGSRRNGSPSSSRARDRGAPVLAPRPGAADTPLDPEAHAAGSHATVWLHRTLPDPTPPAKRLDPSFERALRGAARAEGIGWPLLLGVLRAQGNRGRAPATPAELRELAARLADAGAARDSWRAALVLRGSVSFADQAVALARYNSAVGLWALTHGLAAAKPRLERALLRDPEIDIYPGGRGDIAAGRIDVRVLVLLRYLRVAHGQVTVSSLKTGHGLWARPGFVSAHVYGLAVDISMVGGKPIFGNQEPFGVTDRAVRNILLLPAEIRPQQVISLLGLGGPSFPLADHYDHIHVGF
jgi:hypothetical protein